ncbi:molybdate-binding periplasmic protein ModA [Marinobacterium nitratireducens]|uniref:Molybdate-binding periplasmic protein ModA n=1 Tax=Marinobacterium nitratireducens TaxID=518897 RepID=A0A917Z7E2_9GAMM|nr:molybdate-binding periplasmic protein ModA [Marinobacterium nitratireducens]
MAVATNFIEVMEALVLNFERASGHEVILSSGATGKLYAQIRNGAPFDLFFAADERRPALLEQEGVALPGSRFTYARGELVLWSPQQDLIADGPGVLRQASFGYLAIANPKTAPYGRAAEQTLARLGLWEQLQDRLVRGENIGQAHQYVHSGNAALGFVAKSQVYRDGHYAAGSHWAVPAELYAPIVQQVVQLQPGEAAEALLEYIASAEARLLIERHGYSAFVEGD